MFDSQRYPLELSLVNYIELDVPFFFLKKDSFKMLILFTCRTYRTQYFLKKEKRQYVPNITDLGFLGGKKGKFPHFLRLKIFWRTFRISFTREKCENFRFFAKFCFYLFREKCEIRNAKNKIK